MDSKQAEALLSSQRDFFRTGTTLPVAFRLEGSTEPLKPGSRKSVTL